MKEVSDYTPLIIYMSLGIPIVTTYALIPQQSSKYIKDLWSNRGKNNTKGYEKIYTLSIILSAIAGLYMFYYLTWGNNGKGMTTKKIFNKNYKNEGKYHLYTALLVALGFSLLWIPAFNTKNNMLTKLVLFFVSCGFILLMATIASTWSSGPRTVTNEDKVALASATYLVFHTFVLDFILWTGIV